MPRGKPQRRMVYPNPPQLHPLGPSVRQQCCVVCYKNFTPFEFNSEVWDSNMIKNFYISLNIPLGASGDGEEDEEVLSLPFCPQCHTKVSVMAAYQIELQNIKSKCNSIRNDLAFTVVETIGQNSRSGPIDYIRQQIYEKWKMTYEENQAKSSPDGKVGLEYIACEPSSAPHNCGNFVCLCHSGGGTATKGNDTEMTGNNRPENGFEFDDLDFVEDATRHNVYPKANRGLSLPGWKGNVLPKLKRRPQLVAVERAPPLLSPHKPPFNPQIGIRSRFGGRGTAIPVVQNSGNFSVPAKAIHRVNLGPGKASLTPNNNTGIRRKVDFSHIKPRVPSRFLSAVKRNSKIHISNAMKHHQDEEEDLVENNNMDGFPVIGAAGGGDGVRGKRKLSETHAEGEGSAKMLRHSLSPHKIPVELVEAVIGGSPRSTRNSPRSPMKTMDEHESIPATRYTGAEGIFPCAYCSKEYTLKSRLLRHESDMHPECKLYQCDLDDCGKGFSSREAFKRHVLNAHKIPASEIEMHKCTFLDCQKTFLQIASLERHTLEFHHRKMMSPKKLEFKEGQLDAIQVVGDEIIPKVEEEENQGLDADLETTLEPENDAAPERAIEEGAEDLVPIPTFKVKRKININRPFGARKRRRGGGAKKKANKGTVDAAEGEEEAPAVKKSQRTKRPVVATAEPVRKSSRQRGVQLDAGKPMYPPLEAKSKQVQPPGSSDDDGKSEDDQDQDQDDSGKADSKTHIPHSEDSENLDEQTLVEATPKKPGKDDETVKESLLEESVILGGENPNLKPTSNFKSTLEARLVTSTPIRKPIVGASSFEANESTLTEETEGEKKGEDLNATYTVEESEVEIKVPEI